MQLQHDRQPAAIWLQELPKLSNWLVQFVVQHNAMSELRLEGKKIVCSVVVPQISHVGHLKLQLGLPRIAGHVGHQVKAPVRIPVWIRLWTDGIDLCCELAAAAWMSNWPNGTPWEQSSAASCPQ